MSPDLRQQFCDGYKTDPATSLGRVVDSLNTVLTTPVIDEQNGILVDFFDGECA